MDQSRSFAELMKEFRRKAKIYHRDQNKRESKTSDYTGVMPLNQDENPVNDNQEAYWAQREAYWDQRFSRITVTEECLPESIAEVVGQIIGEDDGLEEMIESQLRSYPAIVLKKCSDERCVQSGEYFCKLLNCGMSQMAVGSILFVAYQLKEPGMGFGGRLFPAKDALSSGIEVDLETLDDDIYTVVGGKTEVGMKTKDVRELSRAYAFLACSMLRMFSKPPENYRMSWRHILDGYRKFYMTEFPLMIQEPSLEVLTQIYDSFKLTRLFRYTLYRFLYNANEKEMVTPLQSYLYDMHLSFTGMHIFPISCKICTSLRVSPRDLLVTIYCRGISKGVHDDDEHG